MKNKIIRIINKVMNVTIIVLVTIIIAAFVTRQLIPSHCRVWQAWTGKCSCSCN